MESSIWACAVTRKSGATPALKSTLRTVELIAGIVVPPGQSQQAEQAEKLAYSSPISCIGGRMLALPDG
jgi:hypothetical protein